MPRKKKPTETAAPSAEGREPLREFVKHRTSGEIWAIQWLDYRRVSPAAGLRCTRPHEQTRGALPALPLDDSDETIAWLEDNIGDLEPWQPPMASAELFDAILAAGADADESHALYEKSAKQTKELKAAWEKDVEELQKLVREAREGIDTPTLPFNEAQ